MMLAVCDAQPVRACITLAESLAGIRERGIAHGRRALFVVAAGISATGGLDWYMGKVLGEAANPGGGAVAIDAADRVREWIFE